MKTNNHVEIKEMHLKSSLTGDKPHSIFSSPGEIIAIIRILLFFPFCGILLPDITIYLIIPGYNVPLSHLLVCILLAVIIISLFVVQARHPKFRSGST